MAGNAKKAVDTNSGEVVRVPAYKPDLGQIAPVFAHNHSLASGTTERVFKGTGYMAGLQTLENGASANVVTLYDGDPGGSDYEVVAKVPLATSGLIDRLNMWPCIIKRGLYVTSTEAVDLYLNLNF